MNWPAHTEFQDTRLEWLGMIPAHWRQFQVRHLIETIEQGVSPQAYGILADDGWGVLKSGCVNGGVFSDVQHKKLPDDFPIDPSLVVNYGDFLVCRASGTQEYVGSAATVRQLRYRLILSDKTFRLRPGPLILPAFLEWVMNSRMYREQVRRAVSGAEGLASNLPMSELKSFRFAVPPRDEQAQIVDLLETETAKVDALIAKQEQLIATLREDRDAVWSELFNEAANSAESVKLRWAIDSIVDGPFGSSLTSAHYTEEGARVIRLGNIGINEFKDTDRAYISLAYARELSSHRVVAGDVVIAGLGDERMPLGRAAVIPEIGPAVVKADCYRVRTKPRLMPEFLAWALSAPQTRKQMAVLARGSTRARLNTSVVGAVPIPLPTTDKQLQIIDRSKLRLAKIDALIDKSTTMIKTLREFRSALITDAVTGKIDVRGRRSDDAAAS